jgi:shikimate kinase
MVKMENRSTETAETPEKPGNWRARPLVLIGLMGSGKSTIGRRLAQSIGWRFVDADEEIEMAAGCSIADMFAIYGEPMFRDLEQRVMTRLLNDGPLVIATGGGAWMQPRIRELIKAHATSLWLRAELDVLLDRVSRRDHRPLLKTGDKQEIMERLMAERYPVYAEADLTVDSSHGPHDRVVERAIATLKEYRG